jgi:hypothetical protein
VILITSERHSIASSRSGRVEVAYAAQVKQLLEDESVSDSSASRAGMSRADPGRPPSGANPATAANKAAGNGCGDGPVDVAVALDAIGSVDASKRPG